VFFFNLIKTRKIALLVQVSAIEHQYRKPLLGSGAAIPINLDGTLILGSDGLFK
jgi:hypothetical protein